MIKCAKVSAFFAENKVRFARAKQICYKLLNMVRFLRPTR